MSRLADAILEFRHKVLAETGQSIGVVKIGLHPEVFNALVYELAEKTKYGFPTIHYVGSPMRVADIEIVRKLPEEF